VQPFIIIGYLETNSFPIRAQRHQPVLVLGPKAVHLICRFTYVAPHSFPSAATLFAQLVLLYCNALFCSFVSSVLMSFGIHAKVSRVVKSWQKG
jgi:hypothetical protein